MAAPKHDPRSSDVPTTTSPPDPLVLHEQIDHELARVGATGGDTGDAVHVELLDDGQVRVEGGDEHWVGAPDLVLEHLAELPDQAGVDEFWYALG